MIASAPELLRDRRMNNLAFWFPLLAATGVPVPSTRIVSGPKDMLRMLDGEPVDGFEQFLSRLRTAAKSVSVEGSPVFLRTGYLADKHSWKDTCCVTDLDRLAHHVTSLVETSAMADMLGFPSDTWVVREFLDLDTRFVAFHGEMPIAVEVRYFLGSGRVICKHPYWPDEAFEGCNDPEVRHQLRHLLLEMRETIDSEAETVDQMAARVAEFFHGWSLDFARGKNGEWYAIDMALAAHSYHWPGCAT